MRKKKEILISDVIGNPADKSVPVVTQYKIEMRALKKRIQDYKELVRLLKVRAVYRFDSEMYQRADSQIEKLEYIMRNAKTTLRKG